MNRLVMTAMAITMASTTIFAAPLTPDEALERLAIPGGPMHSRARIDATPRLVNTRHCIDGDPAVYLFDTGDKGFIIVSADDSADPLLGYSDTGSLDGELPPQLEWWLSEYARQIEYNKENGLTTLPPRKTQSAREAIAPMIKTDWDQAAPYNNMCPASGADRTYTGCVATAMAQVMKYWNYPERGKGQISYNATTIEKRLSLNFALRAFDWNNMLPVYNEGEYTQTEADAVAYLMKACGYAVKMDYGLDSSGALAMNIANALIRYFDYDPNMRYTLRQYYNSTEWESLIYDNLRNTGPILYGGSSLLGGGHSFICDGYDGNGYFHFNWGWTGMSNGYFSLDALNPYSLGIGGGSGGGYNFTQDAVLGIRPPTGDISVPETPVLTQTGSLAAYTKNDSIFFDLFASNEPMWVNYTPETLYLFMGATFHNESDPSATDFSIPVSDIKFMIQPGYATGPRMFRPGIDLAAAAIPDGKYKVTICNAHEDTPDEWLPVKVNKGYFNYIHLTKKGNNYTIENNDVDRLEVVSGEIVGDFYYGTASKVRISVRNDSEQELSSGFAPVIFHNGSLVMLGESVLLTLQPGETVTREWLTTLYSLSQYFSPSEDIQVQLSFFDEGTYNIYSDDILKDMTLKANPGMPRIETEYRPMITNAEIKTENIDGNLQLYYIVSDKNDIAVKSSLILRSGYFAYPMYACVTSPAGENGQMAIETYAGDVRILDTPGEKCLFETRLSFPGAVPGKTYYMMMGYGYGQNFVQIGPYYSYFRLATSGVEDVATDTDGISFDGVTIGATGYDIDIFNLQGVKVASGRDTVETESLARGIYIVRAGDKSKKIVIK